MPDNMLLFVALAIIAGTGYKLINKYVLKETEPYAFALITNIVSAVIFFLLALNTFSFPKEPMAWIVLGIASILWTIIAVSTLISYKATDVSIREPLSQSKTIIALILGILFLREAVSAGRIIGTIVIFLGITLLIYHPERRFGRLSDKGVKWTLFAALLSAFVAIADKAALKWFSLETYGFLVYFFPSIILLFFLSKRTHQVRHLLKTKWKSALAGIALALTAYYFTLKAFSVADVTIVYPLLQLTALLTVIGGLIFMNEREHMWQKIIAVVIIIAGSIILKI